MTEQRPRTTEEKRAMEERWDARWKAGVERCKASGRHQPRAVQQLPCVRCGGM